ncbi:MAG: 4,5-DOPA dioxygenase extradiol [Eubacteriales bacterium]|nr:4,5-DOPA dioxygenase extradiol [Eubacteriales bacterium]
MSNRAPALFIGHGSPMNAIENNEFTQTWRRLGKELPKPQAILIISAHWYTNGSKTTDEKYPRMIYDMYGFPDALYQVEYEPQGAPELAHLTKDLISREVRIDNSWGIDHGTWSILCKMYPDADIPVYQLSIDAGADALTHYQIGREIGSLRDRGVMIIGSGNVVHNISLFDHETQNGFDWAEDFDDFIKESILDKKYNQVVSLHSSGKFMRDAVTTPDHYYPLLYILGAASETDRVSVFNDSCILGALSMTSYLFQ